MRKIMKTEGAVRRMGYGSCLLLLLVLFSCTSIDETLPECRLYVRFRYDYNMEFSDAFASQVNRVDVFVFDKDGTFASRGKLWAAATVCRCRFRPVNTG